MPRYNGVIAYPFEVLVHLVRNYVVLALVYPLLTVPFLIAAAFGGSLAEAVDAWAATFAGAPSFLLGCIHWLTFVFFRYYFLPRFPYAPATLTFTVAGLCGSVMLAAVWSFDQSSVAPSLDGLAAFASWVDTHRDVVSRWFALASAISIGGGLIGLLLHAVGAGAGMQWGIGKWAGRLIVGRRTYDAFVAREAARLQLEYDQYVDEIRRP